MLEKIMEVYRLISFLTSNSGELAGVGEVLSELVIEVESAVKAIGHDPVQVLQSFEGVSTPLATDVTKIVSEGDALRTELDSIWANLHEVLKSLGIAKK